MWSSPTLLSHSSTLLPSISLCVWYVWCGVWCSYKFGRKVMWVDRLEQLEETLYVNQLDIPEEVKRCVCACVHLCMRACGICAMCVV